MSTRELILLSPYKLPGKDALILGNEDVAAFLNGYLALWHPAAAFGAAAPPRVASPYDHEQPTAGHLYAVPDNPPMFLPDDWNDRVREAGAAAFTATAERGPSLDSLMQALRDKGDDSPLFALPPERVAPFLAIGLGFTVVQTLFEAMDHDYLLADAELWQDVQEAIAALADPDADAFRRPLQAAADKLLTAREILYTATIHLLDLCVLDASRLQQPLPATFARAQPLNVLASAVVLEQFSTVQPEPFARLRERVQAETCEVIGGSFVEREDPLLPIESQVWNLAHGLARTRELLGAEVRVFARKRFGFHPQLPVWLSHVGLRRGVQVAFDDAVLPTYTSAVINWSSPDGKQIDLFVRSPHAADTPQTFFNLAHYLHQTIMKDQAATLPLLHAGNPTAPGYDDLVELSRFGPILGQWTTFFRYFVDVYGGEYINAPPADEFHGDCLTEKNTAQVREPVSAFVQHTRVRRRLDAVWGLAALQRGLMGRNDPQRLEATLPRLEEALETGPASEAVLQELAAVERSAAESLGQRLVARATRMKPGYLLLNPCSFTRRVALELEGIQGQLPLEGPVKAFQVSAGTAQLVVEVPAFGFAWFPQRGQGGSSPAGRMKLADSRCVRNEFFEAEIDPATGGLRALRDQRNRLNRVSQQLVFNPGSRMVARDVRVTSTGPALGEVVSHGTIFDEQDNVLATFSQRFRAWLTRPVLDLRIEIMPVKAPEGYPWHAYYGSRFAWADERTTLIRGVNGTSYVTTHTRPETPDYLELRWGRQNTILLTGGLPFHQRHGARMLDVILLPEHETARSFDLSLGLDRDYPMQTALGVVSPAPLVATAKGPPHVGATGWLFHLDAPNLAVTSLRPAASGADAILIRMLECNIHNTQAELRCVRDPQRACFVDARGELLTETGISGDAVVFEVPPSDLVQLRVEFSEEQPANALGQNQEASSP